MTPRRPRRSRAPLLITGLVLLLVAAVAGIAVAGRPTVADIPLDPNIPNERALIALGLSSSPAPGQPTRPIVVDRVLIDGAATYVQWHAPDLAPIHGQFGPQISDGRGTALVGGSVAAGVQPAWSWPIPLPSWVPWHPPTVVRGSAILGPLPATARLAILHWAYTTPPETVRVPLDLRTLAARRTSHPGTRASVAGLTLTLHDLAFTHLTYAYVLPPNISASSAFAPSAWLSDAHGRRLPAMFIGSGCVGGAGGVSCTARYSFPPQPQGAHLTLVIPSLQLGQLGGGRTIHGPWRLSLVIP
jgi:hypothetical protein